MRKEGRGCGGVAALLTMLCLIAAVCFWPSYVSTAGSEAQGTLTAKHETVRVRAGDWVRQFKITAKFKPPGESLDHMATCAVNEQTYDSLRVGGNVSVRYLSSLLNQALIPATRISSCSVWAWVNLEPTFLRGLKIAFGALVILLFLWRMLKSRLAAWLLALWVALLFIYVVMPNTEPAPSHPKASQATVERVDSVTTLMKTAASGGLTLKRPYEVLRLRFTPEGMDTPVVAIDKVDQDSVPVKEGQTVDILYDAVQPRIARIQEGTREFASLERWTVWLMGAALFGVILVVVAAGWFFRVLRGSPAARAARRSPMRKRGRRRF